MIPWIAIVAFLLGMFLWWMFGEPNEEVEQWEDEVNGIIEDDFVQK